MSHRIILLSDTHAAEKEVEVPDGDILIHCGDFSGMSTLLDVSIFNEWMSKLPHKNKILIFGNHETQVEMDMSLSKAMLSNVTVLFDEEITINDIRIYGTSWQPIFGNWSWGVTEARMKGLFSRIPKGLDILVTHCPPYGILDLTMLDQHVGSRSLLQRIRQVNPKYNVFGHIHGCYGIDKISGTTFINCSIMNEMYQVTNKPVVIEI